MGYLVNPAIDASEVTLSAKKAGAVCYSIAYNGNDIANQTPMTAIVTNGADAGVATLDMTVSADQSTELWSVTCAGGKAVALDPSCANEWPLSYMDMGAIHPAPTRRRARGESASTARRRSALRPRLGGGAASDERPRASLSWRFPISLRFATVAPRHACRGQPIRDAAIQGVSQVMRAREGDGPDFAEPRLAWPTLGNRRKRE